MEGIVNSPSKSFITYCFAFLCGVAGASAYEIGRIDSMQLFIGLCVPIFFLMLFWKEYKTRFFAFVILFFLLGIARYSIAVPMDTAVHTGAAPLLATIVAEPDVRIDSVKYIVRSDDGAHGGERVYLSSNLYPRYQYGDQITLDCELQRPEAFEDFRYDMYLATRRVFLTCPRPSIHIVHTQLRTTLLSTLFVFKAHIAERVNRLWPEPYAGFMAGLLYGYRGGLGSLQEQFNVTGVTHIVAISGYNITIISTLLLTLFISLHIRRQHAFWIVVGGIMLFVLFVGASASVVRAGIMGVLVLLARQMGRLSHIASVLALTAVIMTAWNPYVLLWDAGFQLSFLATIGLIYLAPLVEQWLRAIPEFFGLRESVVATLAATIVTLPLILFQFGRLSLVSPLVNMLILPLIPFVMSMGFVATMLSFIFFPLGHAIGFLAWGAMAYIVTIVRWFADLPFAAVDVKIPVWVVVVGYGILGYVVIKARDHSDEQIKD